MVKPLDISKFRKDTIRSMSNVSVGFRDPRVWIDTGNYALNYLISGDFKKGVPLSKVTMFAGGSGAGKSFIVSGNLVREAQRQGVFVVLIDTENALDEEWLQRLGVNTSEEHLLRLQMNMVDDVAKTVSDFMALYRKEYTELPENERPKVLFVIDSLGMLISTSESNQFARGELKGDMGSKPKALASLVRNSINQMGNLDVGMVVTNHTYASQDIFDPEDKVSGGQGFVYASSILVGMNKKKLKDENQKSVVRGIKSVCKVMKTRFNKPFETTEILIPWDTGMDRYSGLWELFESKGLLTKKGNRYEYTSLEPSKSFMEFRKNYTHDHFNRIMEEFHQQIKNQEAMRIMEEVREVPEESTNDDRENES